MSAARIWLSLIGLLCLLVMGTARADTWQSGNALCPNSKLLSSKLVTDICWGAMFPIRLAGFEMSFGMKGEAPEGATRDRICVCGGNLSEGKLPTIGLTTGMWMPTRLMELTRQPYCMPAMNGARISNSSASAGGSRTIGGNRRKAGSNDNGSKNLGQYHMHYYTFPLMAMMGLLNVNSCNPDGATEFDILQFSEMYPNWYDESLSALLNPEAMLFANPVAYAAQPVDCIASTAGKPMDSIHWMAGCWGAIYPYSGFISGNRSSVQSTSLAAAKGLAMLARVGALRRSVGDDAYCSNPYMPVLKKSQYKMQMIYPVPETESGDAPSLPSSGERSDGVGEVDPGAISRGSCTHPIGAATMRWGEWRSRPVTGEDHIYLMWQWVDCCMGAL
ncbi:TraU family protein [Chromobacterium sp. IIBBL 290-4]|uniref:TraU family protein n=1 Tax=Chromobacterium sp. IIBBL 290-4 TaxID=2953890 RepID=UPI0020B714E3|nr:TraU family protein [Chromobacterium sp. IIBBL 290-4]UTH74233.1 TraU family protein [Chromobacterium sp. IIBBL 290-4]